MALQDSQIARRCYLCGYDLQGLPDDHACPECGLPRERRAKLFHEGHGLSRGVTILVLVGWFSFALGLLSWTSPWLMFGALVASIASFMAAYIAHKRRRNELPRVRVIVLSTGVVVLDRPQSWRFHAWTDIGGVKRVVWNGGVVLFNGKGRSIESWAASPLGGRFWAGEFARAVESCLLLKSH